VPELPISTVPGTHLAYDDVRQVIVAATTDWLWSFDGVDWNVWSPPGWIVWPETPGEWGAWTSAAYDRLRDRLVVFGTWEYDGEKWEAAANPESAPPR